MSDTTQTIIDRHLSASQDAERVAADLVDWLASAGIIERAPRAGGDHAPGHAYMQAAGGVEDAASNGLGHRVTLMHGRH